MLETVRWITQGGAILDAPDAGVALLPGKLRIIDQTQLPQELVYLELDDLDEIVAAIQRLSVRGAPAIGCAAALGLAAVMQHVTVTTVAAFMVQLEKTAAILAASRPTAVNLFWALNRCVTTLKDAVSSGWYTVESCREHLVAEGLTILEEDIAMCRAIGSHGAPLIREGAGILTHCNAGALATGDFGTALAPMYVAHEAGRNFTVYSDETRPLLQGSRLTAWELNQSGIDVVTCCDNMAAQLMKSGKIDLVLVGADRIAANGDTANKIGTYGLAVLAKHHGIPFCVAAPSSTIDASLSNGKLIPIEQRSAEEVRHVGNQLTVPEEVRVYNPSFDVTPNDLIAEIITETGVHTAPYRFT